jgi:asparagine synthase (glutamine-hydrolysing)
MCGICGVISGNHTEIEPAVRRMMDAMVHRGPDDDGFELLNVGGTEVGPYAGLGFRRLAILDLTRTGHQPMYHPTTGDCLVFNGEIYNFRRLRAELQCEGVLFRGNSDTEVLLHALSRWGDATLQRLQGMYAFAFFEAKTRRILLARDPLGIKPLYVAASPKRLAFASEIRALRASQLVSEDLDLTGIAGMLAYGAVQAPRTIYRDIRSFPAGHYQWITAAADSGISESSPQRFWRFPATTTDFVDLPTAASNVQGLLRDAVHRHLVADVPVGVFLSAGVDSTIVASLAREFASGVTAFTVGFGADHGQDEVAMASGTAASLGIRHVAVSLDMSNMPQQWDDWIENMDSPSIDGFNTFAVSHRLRQENVVVGLSGLGADELFGGYANFSRAQWLTRALRALQLIPAGVRSRIATSLGSLSGRTSTGEKFADALSVNPNTTDVAIALRRSLSNARMARLGVPPARVELNANYLDKSECQSIFQDCDAFNEIARAEATLYMGNTLLRDTDANSMQHSLEVRVPFLDLPLVDYVSALPSHIKYGYGANNKPLLRLACVKTIPERIARRAKTGFSLPVSSWMRHEMRDSCEASIGHLAKTSLLDSREVRRIWDLFVANEQAIHWSRPLSLVVLGASIR